MSVRIIDPTLQERAAGLLDLLESDFGQHCTEDERLKVIFMELEGAYWTGRRHGEVLPSPPPHWASYAVGPQRPKCTCPGVRYVTHNLGCPMEWKRYDHQA